MTSAGNKRRLHGDTGLVRHAVGTRWLGVGGLVVTFAMVASCRDDGNGLRELTGAVRTPPLEVASIGLPDVGNSGESVTIQAPPRGLYLVYFGYTSCPDVCPTTMSDISSALDALPDALASRVTVAMVTVDPDRDTNEVLTGYLGHFFDHSLALRATSAADLEMAAEAFGVSWEVESHSPGDTYNVAHTAVTFIVDDTGTVVVEWPFGLGSKEMTSDLTILLGEEPT